MSTGREFRLEYTKAAYRDLKRLRIEIAASIIEDLAKLKTDQRPPNSKQLSGEEKLYRLRTGSYRSIYEIGDGVVTVTRVDDRKDVYD